MITNNVVVEICPTGVWGYGVVWKEVITEEVMSMMNFHEGWNTVADRG